jgi:two-component system chemotaxis response regulator CheY
VTHRILIVEDDDTIRESLVDFLGDNGYVAVGAIHGRDALDKLRATAVPPCLIVLDLMMPVMDGESFRAHQLQDPTLSAIPTVVMSAYRELERRAAAIKAIAYLNKPLHLDQLLDLVQAHCPAS